MLFPYWLYQLLPGDQGKQLLELVWKQGSASSAALTVGKHIYTVPNDRVLILHNIIMGADAGAAQISTRRRIMVDPAPGVSSERYELTDARNDVGAGGTSLIWTGEAYVPGGWSVRVESDFDAAVAANSVSGELFGVSIPRGTFILG